MRIPRHARPMRALLCALLAAAPAGLPRADVFVDASSVCAPCDGTAVAPFPTIQEGIDAAAQGETVRVAPGTYGENLQVTGKVVHLLATGGPSQTILDGGLAGPALSLDDAGTSSVTGFRITGGRSPLGGGIDLRGGALPGEPTITRNVITGNQAIETIPGFDGDGGGISITSAPGVTVIGNLITGNSGVRLGGGIALVASSDATIAFNTIAGNTLSGVASGFGPAVGVVYGSNQVIASNIVAGNDSAAAATGALDVYYATPSVEANLLHQNTPANFVSTAGSLPPGNPEADPLFVDAPGGDYHLALPSPAIGGAGPSVPAPAADLDGNPRPIDANGDAVSVADAGCYEHLGRVETLSVTGTGTLSWTAASVTPGAYHVYRSTRSALLAGDYGACQDGRDADLQDLTFEETDTPSPGGAFTFLVGFSRQGADASLGIDSGGSDRLPVPACP